MVQEVRPKFKGGKTRDPFPPPPLTSESVELTWRWFLRWLYVGRHAAICMQKEEERQLRE